MVRADNDAVLVSVRVRPRASSTRIAGERDGRLLLHVTAPPVDSRANDAVCRLLAKTLGVAPSRVHVVGGDRARDKLIRIEGVTVSEVSRRLPEDTRR